jgi:hypothetical protein
MAKQGSLLAGVLLLLVALTGCGPEEAAPDTASGPAGGESAPAAGPGSQAGTAGAEMRSDLLRVEPARARAGDEVELYFPEETERG